MPQFYGFLTTGVCIAALALLYKRKDTLVPMLSEHRRVLVWGLLLTLFYLMLNQEVFRLDPRPVGDNYSYAFPYFNYLFQSFAATGAPPFWNPLVNHGEPTFLFVNHTFLLHLPYIPFYLLAPYLQHIDPYHLFWAATLFANYLQALGIAFLVLVLTKSSRIALFAMATALLSGISVGELHQMQINASILYIPWSLGFLILWYRSEERVYWYLFCGLNGFSLINHYPHLVVYLWLMLGMSWCLMHRQEIPNVLACIRRLNFLHFSAGILLSVIVALPTLWIFVEYAPQLLSPYRGELAQSLSAQYLEIASSTNSNSLNPHTLLHYFLPQGFMSLHGIGQGGVSDNIIFYIGILPLFFVGYSLYATPGSNRAIKLTIFLVLLLGMGGHSFGYYFLYNYFPFANLQRIPLHVADYLSFLLIVLASQGLHSFAHDAKRQDISRIGKKIPYSVILVAAVLFPAIYYVFRHPELEVARIVLDDVVFLCIIVAVFVWLDANRARRGFWIVLALFLIFDIGRFYHQNLKLELQPRQPYFPKVLPGGDDFFKWQSHFDFPGRFESGKVYHALLLGLPMVVRSGSELVVFADYDKFRKQYKEFFEPNADKVFLQRVYLIPSKPTSSAGAADDILATLKEEKSPSLYEVTKAWPDEFDLHVFKAHSERLVWLDHNDKGWSVEVNGKSANIIPFGPFKSVVLGEGSQEVRWMYRPVWRWFIYLDILLYLLLFAAIFRIVINFTVSAKSPASEIFEK